MKEARFWAIVANARRNADDATDDSMADALKAELLALESDEITSFQRIWEERHDAAYHWDLWGAAYILGGGCSDDAFMDFRTWLISMGETVYAAALKDAESLAELSLEDPEDDCFLESFAYAAHEAYEAKSGNEMPVGEGKALGEPAGEEWEESPEALESRFPKLFAKYASDWTSDDLD